MKFLPPWTTNIFIVHIWKKHYKISRIITSQQWRMVTLPTNNRWRTVREPFNLPPRKWLIISTPPYISIISIISMISIISKISIIRRRCAQETTPTTRRIKIISLSPRHNKPLPPCLPRHRSKRSRHRSKLPPQTSKQSAHRSKRSRQTSKQSRHRMFRHVLPHHHRLQPIVNMS